MLLFNNVFTVLDGYVINITLRNHCSVSCGALEVRTLRNPTGTRLFPQARNFADSSVNNITHTTSHYSHITPWKRLWRWVRRLSLEINNGFIERYCSKDRHWRIKRTAIIRLERLSDRYNTRQVHVLGATPQFLQKIPHHWHHRSPDQRDFKLRVCGEDFSNGPIYRLVFIFWGYKKVD